MLCFIDYQLPSDSEHFTDLKTNAWSMVGSENETMICDTEDVSYVRKEIQQGGFPSLDFICLRLFATRYPRFLLIRAPDKSYRLQALLTSVHSLFLL